MTSQRTDTSWTTVVKEYIKCPKCDNGILNTRIKRSLIVKYVFTWIGDKRYLCNVCGKQSYIKT